MMTLANTARLTSQHLARNMSSLPEVIMHADIKGRPWVESVADTVLDFFDSKEIRDVFTSPIRFDKEGAARNLKVLQKAHCLPIQRCLVIDSTGKEVDAPFYGQVALHDSELTASIVDTVTHARHFPSKEGVIMAPKFKDFLDRISHSAMYTNESKLDLDGEGMHIEWPNEMAVEIPHGKESSFVILSESATALDKLDMAGYMQRMSPRAITAYANRVLSFTIITGCLNPTTLTLPIRPGEIDTIIVKDFNYYLGTSATTDDSTSLLFILLGLRRAVKIGKFQKLPDLYLRILFDGHNELCRLANEAKGFVRL